MLDDSIDKPWKNLFDVKRDTILGEIILVQIGKSKEKSKVTVKDWDRRCGICFDSFNATDDELIRQLKCKHVFHIECSEAWLQISKKCPLCMHQPIVKNDTISTTDNK